MIRNTVFRQFCLVFASLLSDPVFASAADPIPGIGPVGEVVKVHGDFQFTEGPAWDGKGNLYLSDVAGNKLYKIDSTGTRTVILDPSGPTNGLMFNAAGTLFGCQMSGQVVTIDVNSKTVTPLAPTYEGKRFNAPNDLVIDGAGGVYFTDPSFRAPMPWPQEKTCVYYIDAERKVTRLITDLPNPNGVILSPDEKTLYVIPSGQKEMVAYAVQSPGKLSSGRVFCSLKQSATSKGAGEGGDGLALDSKGNLYITSKLGLQVFNPDGKLLGIIEFPEQPANAKFGGTDLKTLYVTARTSVYSVKMEVTGHQFPGKK